MAENVLTREVAGQPVGVWLVVVAGGLGLAYFFNRNQTGDAQREPLVEPGVGTGLIPAGAGFQSSGDNGDSNDDGYSNNLEWGNAVKNWLLGQGHDGTTVDRAVNKYLAGEQLSVQENALMTAAIANLGAPPDAGAPAPEPEGTGAPSIDITGDKVSAKRGEHVQLTGRIGLGGQSPGRQLVKITLYHSVYPPNIPWSTYMVETKENGSFTTKVHSTPVKGRVTFEASWRGVTSIDSFNVA